MIKSGIIVVFLSTLACLIVPSEQVSGTEPQKYDYAFVAVIDTWDSNGKTWKSIGHATIINPWTLITTVDVSTLFEGAIKDRNVRIGAGHHNLNVFENTRQYRLPCSLSKTSGKLILINLSEPFRFSKYVTNIALPKSDITITGLCRFGAWGGTDGNFKTIISEKKVNLQSSCSDANSVCTDAAPCKGDGGAPLICVYNNRMYGYGIATNTASTCGSGTSTYVATNKIDVSWLTQELQAAKDKCRTYYSIA